jgi:hypothetical protein
MLSELSASDLPLFRHDRRMRHCCRSKSSSGIRARKQHFIIAGELLRLARLETVRVGSQSEIRRWGIEGGLLELDRRVVRSSPEYACGSTIVGNRRQRGSCPSL